MSGSYSQEPALVLRLDFTGEAELDLYTRHASHRSTRSSRTPGRLNVGTVYANGFKHPELHNCGCGQKQHQCPSCGKWICEAPGHLKHVCGSAW